MVIYGVCKEMVVGDRRCGACVNKTCTSRGCEGVGDGGSGGRHATNQDTRTRPRRQGSLPTTFSTDASNASSVGTKHHSIAARDQFTKATPA